jgi:hypothetical protein
MYECNWCAALYMYIYYIQYLEGFECQSTKLIQMQVPHRKLHIVTVWISKYTEAKKQHSSVTCAIYTAYVIQYHRLQQRQSLYNISEVL